MNYILVENRNPVIKPAGSDGKQEIGVHDWETGNRRYIVTDSKKVDEYTNSRRSSIKKSYIVSALLAVGSTIAGALIGKKTVAKTFGSFGTLWAAVMGGMLGCGFGVLPPRIVDKKITQKFIDENK